MYKLSKDISPTKTQESLRLQNNSKYNLRSQNTFKIPFKNSLYNGTLTQYFILAQRFRSFCEVI